MSAAGKAILLTPMGAGAIAVVRLAGPGVLAFLTAHLSRTCVEGACVHGELRDGNAVIDDPIVVLGPGGHFADINLHGGPWVIQRVIEVARRDGFEVDEKGRLPLSDDAVDACDELEREVLTHLPMARTELALRALLGQRQIWRAIHHKLKLELQTELPRILRDRALHWLLHPPRVAIVGQPNVGKSTLANQLYATDRSITADLPGTTRDWVGEIANIDGLAVLLIDTPGLRESADDIERQSIERSDAQIASADLVLLVLDASTPRESHRPMIERFPKAMVVLNKWDRADPHELDPLAGAATGERGQRPGPQRHCTIATTGQGIAALRRAVSEHFGCDDSCAGRPMIWTGRQRRIVERALTDPAAIQEITRCL